MEEKIKELFGPDPFFAELVLRHVKEYLKYFPNLSEDKANSLVVSELEKIAADKEVCSEFIRCLLKNTFDWENAISLKGLTAKEVYEKQRPGVNKDPIRVYGKMVSVKEQLEKNYNFDPNLLFVEEVYGTPKSMGINANLREDTYKQNNSEQNNNIDQKYNIKPEQNLVAKVYGPPRPKKTITDSLFINQTNNSNDRIILELIEVIAEANQIYCNSLKNFLANIHNLTREQVIGMLHTIAIFKDIKREFLENVYNNNYERCIVKINGFTAKDIYEKNSKYNFLETYNDLAIMRIKME